MTNSPPSKSESIQVSSGNIKASGIDTLVISLKGEWKNLEWFSYFADLKKTAQESSSDCSGKIHVNHEWSFQIKPNGTQGFEWILVSRDFTLKIGRWAKSKSRPNIMAEIRSEMLWRIGAKNSTDFIVSMLSEMGFEIEIVKPSRVDLCIDILFPKSAWDKELIEYAVTKASERAIYMKKAGKYSGMSFGRGEIMARLYDKGLEIRDHSKKFWMFDVWEIIEIPTGKIMLRVEFQLRREPLKELGINTLDDLFEKKESIWTYCTIKWLKFQDNINAHADQRNTMPWWSVVQSGYHLAVGVNPAIRAKIIKIDVEQLTRQAFGILLSIAACILELTNSKEERIKIEHVLSFFVDSLIKIGKTPDEMNEKIQERRARFNHLSIQETGE